MNHVYEVTPVRRVDKPWGHEEIFAFAEGLFCGKTLHVNAGESLSLQYHERKTETVSIWSGTARFEVGPSVDELETIELEKGQSLFLPAGTVHRLTAVTDVVVLEASTPEIDDVVRIDDRYGRSEPATV
jgi:mannose-6-phosphate isomerase-like protein (cupin superfamily)